MSTDIISGIHDRLSLFDLINQCVRNSGEWWVTKSDGQVRRQYDAVGIECFALCCVVVPMEHNYTEELQIIGMNAQRVRRNAKRKIVK